MRSQLMICNLWELSHQREILRCLICLEILTVRSCGTFMVRRTQNPFLQLLTCL